MISKPKVLILTDWFVPGYKAGGPIKSALTMIQLMREQLEFSVITRNTDWNENDAYDVKSDEWIDEADYKVKYLATRYLVANLKVLNQISTDETVFFNGVYSLPFNSGPLIYLLLKCIRPKIIVSARGMLNSNAIAIKGLKKRLLLMLMRSLGIEQKVIFHAASLSEKFAISKVFPKASIIVASNIPAIPSENSRAMTNSNKFLSIGRISIVKNTHLLVELFKNKTDLKLTLIGSYDEFEYAQRCKQIAEFSNNISFLGALPPKEAAKFFDSHGFFILCTSGENFGHSIIEALASGTPVIISDQTPWNDLEEFGAGWVIQLEDRARWERVLVKASRMHSSDYEQMSQRAIEYVRTKFDLNEIRTQYTKLFGAKN